MILLCGIPSEAPLRLVHEAALAEGVPCVLFNQRQAGYIDLHLSVASGHTSGLLRIEEAEYPLDGMSGVYVRLMDHRQVPETRLRAGLPGKIDALHEMLLAWLEISQARVMNRASAMASNIAKPYQALAVAAVGFLTPPTLVTNDPREVLRFRAEYGRLIFKSISSERSIVRELDEVKLGSLHQLHNLPTQFQAYIPGANIRVHVVGERIFSTEIQSPAIDYRYAASEGLAADMTACRLPAEIDERCLALAQHLRLPLCGIDLKRTPEGRYYCFEVNPSPGYSYYQERTGQDIAGAIVRWLAA